MQERLSCCCNPRKNEDERSALWRDWLDTFYLSDESKRTLMLNEVPPLSESVWDALVAAGAEWLAHRMGRKGPLWAMSDAAVQKSRIGGVQRALRRQTDLTMTARRRNFSADIFISDRSSCFVPVHPRNGYLRNQNGCNVPLLNIRTSFRRSTNRIVVPPYPHAITTRSCTYQRIHLHRCRKAQPFSSPSRQKTAASRRASTSFLMPDTQ